ncbi:uncharacterized protein TNCV_4017121 [Trichonephila clavipes]|nr:uncharacterized protein TNCV_4017121 [Trichonephila clavipes]
MDPTYQQGTVQVGEGSGMVWSMCSWRDMGLLICLDMTLIGDRYVTILSDHLHSFMSIVHSEGLREFQQDSATPPHVQNCYILAPLLNLDTSSGHQNPQT